MKQMLVVIGGHRHYDDARFSYRAKMYF